LPTLLFGGAFTAVGLLIYALLLSGILTQPDAMKVPAVILWLIGTVMFSAGLGMMCLRFMPKFAGFCTQITLYAFIAVFNWVAFGPGERQFTTRTSASGPGISYSTKQPVSETTGRLVFGIFAGAMDAVILFGLYKALKRRLKDRRGIPPAGDSPANRTEN